ncbi:SpdD protein, partial [Streptomyces sp. NPDC045369]
ISVSTGAVAAVLIGGVVLTALLAAVAVSAVSVAVAAVVLRSLLRDQHRR